MLECPPIETLDQLASGGALPDVRAHVEACGRCRTRIGRIRANNGLLDNLAQLGPGRLAAALREPSSGSLPAPDAVSGYEILSEIHRGGQGVVYKAVQIATKRTVALKMLLRGAFATAGQRRRFEREIELVAALRHPNIVTIYESGVTADGRHYFAMEYVHGAGLDRWISDFRPALDAAVSCPGFPISDSQTEPAMAGSQRVRAELIRDRKSSIDQVLGVFSKICQGVTYAHQRGIIHRDLKPGNILIDEGGDTHIVDFGLAKAVGGPGGVHATMTGEFMGTFAYASPEQVRGDPDLLDTRTDVYSLGVILYEMLTHRPPYAVDGPMADVLRNITHAEPARPSTLRREIDDELDTIVLKALAKDPQRRYQSAAALQQDISHYLNGRPIDAKRDSTWYVLRKTARRYRAAVAVAIAFVTLLIAFAVTMALMYGQAARAEQVAHGKQVVAETESAKAHQIQKFLRSMLSSVRPEHSGPRQLTVRQVLDAAARRVETELEDQPEVEAAVRHTMADAYHGVGAYDAAEVQARAALGIRRDLLGSEHDDVAESGSLLADVLQEKGQYVEAERLQREALTIYRRIDPPDHARITDVLTRLAQILCYKGDHAATEALVQEVLPQLRGRDYHQHMLCQALNSLGGSLFRRGEYAAAEPVVREALTIAQSMGLADSWQTVQALMVNLAGILSAQEQYVEAEPLVREALRLRRATLPPGHAQICGALVVLGEILTEAGDEADWAEAEQLLRECVEIREKSLPAGSPSTVEARRMLGRCLARLGRFEEAEPLLTYDLPGPHTDPNASPLDIQRVLHYVVDLYDAWGKPELASRYRELAKTLAGSAARTKS